MIVLHKGFDKIWIKYTMIIYLLHVSYIFWRYVSRLIQDYTFYLKTMNLFKLSQNNRKLKNISLLSFDEIEQTVSNWNLPEIPYKEIYNFPSTFSLKTKPYIKTVEETITINEDFAEIKLLENEIDKIKDSG